MAFGFTHSDAESEQAIIHAENGINAVRAQMEGPILTECQECGNDIPEARVLAMRKNGMKCVMCVSCQEEDDKRPKARIKMLDRIL